MHYFKNERVLCKNTQQLFYLFLPRLNCKKHNTNPISVQISLDLSGLIISTLFGAEPPSTVHVIVYLLPISTSLSLKYFILSPW